MNVGLHLFGMWMLDGRSLRRMYHDHLSIWGYRDARAATGR